MIPLETLDSYMLICGLLGAAYILFMLGMLICFLRKYNCGGLNGTTCPQMEMRPTVLTPAQPYQYTVVTTQSSDSIITPSCATRSNRSYCSKQSSHIYYKPQPVKKATYIRAIPDFSQMERLATL